MSKYTLFVDRNFRAIPETERAVGIAVQIEREIHSIFNEVTSAAVKPQHENNEWSAFVRNDRYIQEAFRYCAYRVESVLKRSVYGSFFVVRVRWHKKGEKEWVRECYFNIRISDGGVELSYID